MIGSPAETIRKEGSVWQLLPQGRAPDPRRRRRDSHGDAAGGASGGQFRNRGDGPEYFSFGLERPGATRRRLGGRAAHGSAAGRRARTAVWFAATPPVAAIAWCRARHRRGPLEVAAVALIDSTPRRAVRSRRRPTPSPRGPGDGQAQDQRSPTTGLRHAPPTFEQLAQRADLRPAVR